MQAAVRKIVIVGGGTAGWMAAAALIKALGSHAYDMTLIESEDIGTVGVGEATIPPIVEYNYFLGLDEDEFIRETNATFKLGIQFQDWRHQGHSYFHPFGLFGTEIDGFSFPHYYFRHYHKAGLSAVDIGKYNAETEAAFQGRFGRVRREPGKPPVNYAFQFDAALYARYLRKYAEKRGVVRQEGKIVTVNQHPETGFITSVQMENGRVIEGDLFIDCSGFRGLLIEQTLKTGYTDWSHWLPMNRAAAVPCERAGELLPYTRATAREAGWQWRIPLQHRDGNGLVFASAFMDETQAADQLMANLEGPALADPRLIRFRTGRRKKVWEKNCVAIGLAAGFLEPLESTAIMLIQKAIAYLQYLFPDKGFSDSDRDLYNADMSREYEVVRDFLILHYRAGERADSEFWRYCSSMPIPDSLQNRMDLFQSRGRIQEVPGEQFRIQSWLAVMWGQGLRPAAADPLAMTLDEGAVNKWLAEMREVIARCCDYMPSHKDFIAQHCAANLTAPE